MLFKEIALENQENTQRKSLFEQFCGDFGYDTDSRKALKTYLAVQQEAADFRRLCRDDVVIAEAEEIQ